MNSRLIQLFAIAVMVVCTTVCGMLLPPIHRSIEHNSLRYTDVTVEGAPTWVAVGTAIGALRGLIVDALWIKVQYMKQKGLFYEVMADAELITKLQPRFGEVWVFHGHNMAYNISVATHTQEERWEWVNAGIRLVRNEGLRYNPHDLTMHRNLAFWFAHKIEGYADDAHLYYKREFGREWQQILGTPPDDYEERIAWIRKIADAPGSLTEAEARTPGVRDLIARLEGSLTPYGESASFEADRRFLRMYSEWQAVTEQSEAAAAVGMEQQLRREVPYFATFDAIASDPAVAEQWDTLVHFVRKRVLLDEYNMDPQLMYEYTRDLGPIDWRHGQAHALYWSRRGSQYGDLRMTNDDQIYKVLNNDRLQMQAMQDLARYGRVTFDPFSDEIPARMPDLRWIETIAGQFEYFYKKHYDTRGAGGESFIGFLENFMSSSIRIAYRSGDHELAQRIMDLLDSKFGRGLKPQPNNKYAMPLDVFVKNQVKGQIELQPHVAATEASSSLRYGLRVGIGMGDEKVYEEALEYARWIIRIYKEQQHSFVTKFGSSRMGDLLKDLPTTKRDTFVTLMTDPTVRIREKATIWAAVDKVEPRLRMETFDLIAPRLAQQFGRHELSAKYTIEEMFPVPPGLVEFRAAQAEQRAREQAAEAERAEIGRSGG